ncbi:MAG TPA: Fis family transcriptional regulator [Spongiibacteraceae bacterium]|nr:Fis family transcriptional regulator [Spongiibacteraceae bacterium]HCS26803.1 Fis family transcriptional regulator [Spongiibacteraceae bacterium]|tara:strand:- start:208 stop:555 length:348 start_codon:yes stop_codon:yes gene_type:complete
MKKSDKKTDNAIREALTRVCEQALEHVVDFQWITHTVNYNSFPGSLSVVCVFETDEGLALAISRGDDDMLRGLIQDQLSASGIQISDIRQRVRFDTEEACLRNNSGRWGERLRQH